MYLNANLAKVYGIPGVTGTDLQPVDVQAPGPRLGHLHAAGDPRGVVAPRPRRRRPPRPLHLQRVRLRPDDPAAARQRADGGGDVPRGRLAARARHAARDERRRLRRVPRPLRSARPLDGELRSHRPLRHDRRQGSAHRRVGDAQEPRRRSRRPDHGPARRRRQAQGGPARLRLRRRATWRPSCSGARWRRTRRAPSQSVKDQFAKSGSFADYFRAMLTSPGFATRDAAP